MRINKNELTDIIKESVKKCIQERDEWYELQAQEWRDQFMHDDPEGFAEEYNLPIEQVYAMLQPEEPSDDIEEPF